MFLFNQVSWPMAAMFGALLVLSFVQPIWSRKALAKARSRNSIKGSTVTFSVDGQGVNTVGPNSNSHTQWSGLPSAIFYPQGGADIEGYGPSRGWRYFGEGVCRKAGNDAHGDFARRQR
jgi:hypothetical protein